MSLSGKNKFIVLIFPLAALLIFGYVQSAAAATFKFQAQIFEFNPRLTPAPAQPQLRVRSLNQLTEQILLGTAQPIHQSLLDPATLEAIIRIQTELNRPPANAHISIADNVATAFNPGLSGQSVDVWALYQLLLSSTDQSDLPVFISPPAIGLRQTNDLGLIELVAAGESDFSGSPNNRVHNIKIGADKFQGLIVKPGEEFSFNRFLGDVDGEHGFLPELVIKKDGLVAEFGGGLCQVSSTAFRAAMNGGLPVTERRNHSFAVRYYAPQGTDATIYPGVVDLKFQNDLPSHLLITTRITGNRLYFEFYGTKDDRTIVFDGPYQYDQTEDGSMKAVWTRTVIRGGQAAEQVFRSAYLSPALFTKIEVPATPNPDTPNNNL